MTATEPATYPFPPASDAERYAEFVERRSSCPMGHVKLPTGHEAVLLVTYEDVAAGLYDPRLTHDLTAPGSPRLSLGSSLLDYPEAILNMDGPGHLRIRRIVASAFTPRRIERWLPTIESIANTMVDELEEDGSPAEMIKFCVGFPVRVICRLLGVTENDDFRFQRWSEAFMMGAQMTEDERLTKVLEFAEYVTAFIAERRETPGQDLIDALIAARDGTDQLNEQELVVQVLGLLAGGNETTSTFLGRFMVALLRDDRALWEQLLDDPERIPAAVDELLRRPWRINNGLLRVATEDVEVPSGTIRAGEAVVLNLDAAQSDPSAYADPQDTKQLAFGGGPHFCLGSHLAKAELRTGLRVLLKRLPGLRLDADLDSLRYTGGDLISSLVALPVAW